MTDQETLSFGLLLLPDFQLLDAVGPVDFINSHSQQYLRFISMVPASLVSKAPSIKWHYISHSLEPVQSSSFPAQHPTTTFKECPKLDYLIIPGPDPTKPLPEGCAEWLKRSFEKDLKGLLLVCTGSLAVAGSTDILNGLNSATNKMALKMVGFISTLSSIEEKSSGWVTSDGLSMGRSGAQLASLPGLISAVEFVKRTFDPEVVEAAKNLMEYTGKPDAPDEFAFILEGVSL